MSVGVCVANHEGFALAAESRRLAELAGPEPRHEIVSENARKLFLVDERLAVATHGQATIGERTIGALMEEFTSPPADGAVAYANALGEWFARKLSAGTQPRRGDLANAESMRWPLGFAVAGFDGDTGHLYEVAVRAGDHRVELKSPGTANPGVHAFGQTDGIDRFLSGVDRSALKKARISLSAEDERKLGMLAYGLIVPEDLTGAAALAESLLGLQLLAQRCSWGTLADGDVARIPGCGGQIKTITIARDGGRWARAPEPSPTSRRGVAEPSGVALRLERWSA